MVHTPKKQSQGFAVQMSVLLEKLVQADLGESIKLNPLNVLNNKSFHTYMKKNQVVVPDGDSSKKTGDTAGTEGGQSRMTKTLEKAVEKEFEKKRKKEKVVLMKKHIVAGSQATPEQYTAGPAQTRTRSLCPSWKKQRTQRMKPMKKNVVDKPESNLGPILEIPSEAENVSTSAAPDGNMATTESIEEQEQCIVRSTTDHPAQKPLNLAGKGVFSPIEIRAINWVTHFLPKIDPSSKGKNCCNTWTYRTQFRTSYRLNKVAYMKLVEEFEKVEDIAFMGRDKEEYKAQLAQLTNSTPDKQMDQGKEHQAPERTAAKKQPAQQEDQVKEIARVAKNVEETEAMNSQEHQAQGNEQHAQEEERPDQGAEQLAHKQQDQDSSSTSCPTHREANNNADNKEGFSQSGPQKIACSGPQEDFDTGKELTSLKDIVSSLDSKVDRIKDDTFVAKHTTLQFRRQLETKIDGLETTLVCHFADIQQNLAGDLELPVEKTAQSAKRWNRPAGRPVLTNQLGAELFYIHYLVTDSLELL
ncbi:hypothetical protein F511_10845 [Dorcoceras hygrometricum]|uniref:Uncharacterized protein n=1 Tax=Dorcoceras hygrometricum TaxID=472368 RepID=A0A2Z7BJG6_9LAMI|nr:hypothetical protein F511_10845 [Dorcoceras hygrometricum]